MENPPKEYLEKKQNIKSKLLEFKELSEKEKYKEFLFCLLTPQSNAQRCWQAVEEISKQSSPSLETLKEILSSKTRFHNTKALRIFKAKESWNKITPLLHNENILLLRNQISENVNGYGLKESSHFLRNIGKSNNQIAILDRHILRNLQSNNIITDTKIKSKKHYLEIESAFLNFSKQINIPADELDLLWWSRENGEIFK